MELDHLRAVMKQKRVRIYELARMLKMSDASFSHRLAGRYEFAPHERARLSAFFGINQNWLFSPLVIPPSARRETAMISPGMETRVG